MIWGLDSRVVFLGILGLVIVERLFELRLAKRHERSLAQRGGREIGAEHYPFMVTLHAAFLLSLPIEILWFERPFLPPLGLGMLILLSLTMALRYWVIHTLGDRWTTRVFIVPGEQRIVEGPYRVLRHPNYLAVVFEILALSLLHTAWLSAIVFSILNAWLLSVRIRVEDRALQQAVTD